MTLWPEAALPQTGPASLRGCWNLWSKSWCEIFHRWQSGCHPWDETQQPARNRWSTAETRSMQRKARFSTDCSANTNLDNGSSGYLDLSQLLLLLPVPNRQDVIVGIIHSTQERATILTGWEPVQYNHFEQVHISKSPDSRSSYRLGESHACDRSVKHSHPDNVERVEGHGVPNANMRRERLNIHKWKRHTGFKKHRVVSKNLQPVGARVGWTVTFPSLEFPATWPVAMVTISGCTHKLRREN